MKYIWEEEDITVGRFYVKQDATADNTFVGYVESTLHMIGYTGGSGKNLTFISIADGMVGHALTPVEFCEMLNNGNYVPAHHDLVVKVFEARRARNEGR